MSGLRPRPTGIRFSTFDFLFSNRDKVNMGFVVRDLSPVIASVQISGYYQWQQRRDQVIVRALPALFQVTDRQINPTTGGFDGQVILTPFRNHIITPGSVSTGTPAPMIGLSSGEHCRRRLAV